MSTRAVVGRNAIQELRDAGLIKRDVTALQVVADVTQGHAVANNQVIKTLVDAGVIPEGCKKFWLYIDANQAVTMNAVTFVFDNAYEHVIDALVSNPEDAAKLIKVKDKTLTRRQRRNGKK